MKYDTVHTTGRPGARGGAFLLRGFKVRGPLFLRSNARIFLAVSILNSLRDFKVNYVVNAVVERICDGVDIYFSSMDNLVQFWGCKVEFRNLKTGNVDSM